MKRLADPMTPLAQRIRGLEMPWNRVLSSTTDRPVPPARWDRGTRRSSMAECVETIPEAGE